MQEGLLTRSPARTVARARSGVAGEAGAGLAAVLRV